MKFFDGLFRKRAAVTPELGATLANNSGGLFKRIDENRELFELLKEHAPEFLREHSHVKGWLEMQDQFLSALQVYVPVEQMKRFKPSVAFPRPWPGRAE